MVKMRYLGVIDPVYTFGQFRPWHATLCDLQTKCTPLKADYQALGALIVTLDQTAAHFTGKPDFYRPAWTHPGFPGKLP